MSLSVCHKGRFLCFQAQLCECAGHHHPAHPGSVQGVAVRPGLRIPHREHLQRHQDRYGEVKESKKKRNCGEEKQTTTSCSFKAVAQNVQLSVCVKARRAASSESLSGSGGGPCTWWSGTAPKKRPWPRRYNSICFFNDSDGWEMCLN